MCTTGYTGQNCESEYIPCDPSPCANGGSCQQLDKLSYECHCPEGESCTINFNLENKLCLLDISIYFWHHSFSHKKFYIYI